MPRGYPTQLSAMKRAALASLQQALAVCPEEEALRRWWRQAEAAARHQPPEAQMVIFEQTWTLFELLIARAGWRR
jgi:hypothetical protein